MNIVFQRLAVTPGEQFDLVIGTNIFIYYGPFEQSLARANIASLLRPGGFLLSNQQLDDAVPSGLEQVMVVDIPMTDSPVIADHIYCYRRKP
jgi:predicted TPR repeat methyltransferase